MRMSDFGAEESTASLFGLGEEMDYSQGLPTPMGYLGQDATADGSKTFLLMGLIAGLFQGAVAYAIMSNAGKWKNPLKTIGYVGGGVLAVGAIGSLAIGLAGKQFVDSVRKPAPAPAPVPAPASSNA